MSGLKPPTTFKNQVNKLVEHGMEVLDLQFALDFLSKNNYYRFTGYGIQFRSDPSKSDYEEGTTFDEIFHLYRFDEELRLLLLRYICKAEVYYRTIISYGFSHNKCIKAPHDQHYCRDNYYLQTKFDEVIESVNSEKNYYKDSLVVKHHEVAYNGKMPLWVIVELMSFSNLSKYYNTMYYSEKDAIAALASTGRDKLTNRLHCLSVLRNKCAHWARLYNISFSPSVSLGASFYKKYPNVKNDTLFAYVLNLGVSLHDKGLRTELLSDLKSLIGDYNGSINTSLMGFPDDWEKAYKEYTKLK